MAPYARREVTLTLLSGAAATVLVGWLAGWWAVVPAALALLLLSFYRDPQRTPPRGADLLLAPADGRLVGLRRNAEGPDGRPMLRMTIFLSVTDVHINRAPCAGRVVDVRYRPGKFVNALRAEADTCNECNTVTLEPESPLPGPVAVRQIAGVLARRIVCVLRPGDRVAAGERFGMIKLGSRTEIAVPDDSRWELGVSLHDAVRAGVTVLARWRGGAADGAGSASQSRETEPGG